MLCGSAQTFLTNSGIYSALSYNKDLQDFQKRKSGVPKPATSYRRKKVEKEDLPEDTELYRDPTLALYQYISD